METITSIKPVLAVCVSVFGTLLIIAFRKKPNLREASTFLVAITKFGIVAYMIPVVLGKNEIVCNLIDVLKRRIS